ncbi:MAG: UvrD-helicase domain-containing protein [Holosporaceae bacterium]|jgi:ATP-dependent helicase/nuclease subunit A|nr:UvrD-helicase domain-containing protein [Holosporaceae bacterium]
MPGEIRDIEASLWISASAGTGKTKSLVERILALLLSGAKASKILCLTYTNAAAAEMLGRLSGICRRWNQAAQEDLLRELKDMGFDESYAKLARSLREKSLGSEWVCIQTIHSFCLGILRRFPLETGLLPGIKLCDGYRRKQMLDAAVESVLVDEKHRAHWETVAAHVTDVMSLLTDDNITKIQHFVAKIQDFTGLYGDFFNLDRDYYGLSNQELNERLFLKIFDNRHRGLFAELAEILFSGSATDVKKAEILRANSANPTEKFVDAFLKSTGQIYDRLCTKAIAGAGFQERMAEVALKALQFQDIRRNYAAAKANVAFFSVASKIVQKFTELKSLNHCLDFSDVIAVTAMLLDDIDWIVYKIDGNVDHILIDEAQDTSPEQWEIIRKISDEFFANYRSNRTLCVVGDEKQSIYSFQGADVKLFGKMRAYFKNRSTVCGQKFHEVLLNESYRTTGGILSFVDDVFAGTFPGIKHLSRRDARSGVVEIVDLFEEDDPQEETVFWERDDARRLSSAGKLSLYVAEFIKNAVEKRVLVESKQRAAMASDFLILFQRRDVETMENIVAALKDAGICATGVDKVLLKDQLIVEDLMAFAEFAVFPRDDLMCARCLKSPLVGMTEEDLMRCCLDRQEEKLWNYLQNNEELYRKYSLNKLQSYVDGAFRLSAYDFFTNALTDGAEEKFLRRLGAECLDVLHEFLDVAMLYEEENSPSLPSFLHWFKSFEHEIKRESFSEENAVRLMTVHASKGLQAPFVLIADAHFFQTKGEKFLETEEKVLLWNFGNDARAGKTAPLHEKNLQDDLEESRRLLYVALTRAEDAVCILGQKRANAPNDKCWYNFVKSGLDEAKFTGTSAFGAQLLRSGVHAQAAEENQPKADKIPEDAAEIPSWFYEKLPALFSGKGTE